MKKGFWNYTEPVEYRIVFVKLLAVPETLMHWQNAIVGETCQAVEATTSRGYKFLIFNDDGTGWCKLEKRGGPDSPSKHIAQYEFVSEVPEEHIIKAFDHHIYSFHEEIYRTWAEKNHPTEYETLKGLEKHMKELYRKYPNDFPYSRK